MSGPPGPSHEEWSGRATPRLRRWAALLLVVVVVVGAALIDRLVPPTVPPPAAAQAVSAIAPADAESSAWYCAGSTGASTGTAVGTLYLTNTTADAVGGTVTVVDLAGTTAGTPVHLTPHGQLAFQPSSVSPGAWLAARVDFSAGGVVVTQGVHGPSGWAQAACASSTSTDWYFASGSTAVGAHLLVALYDPGAAAAVVDLTFVTSQGATQPQPFQGVIVPPGQVVVEEVGAYVQDEDRISTDVHALSGRVVADELEVTSAGGVGGLSLRLGAPRPDRHWYLPTSFDAGGSTDELWVFNPAPAPQRVRVAVRLPSGPVTPVTETVAADSTWVLTTSQLARIPSSLAFATVVSSTGGPGVVVDRVVDAGSGAAAPQWGAVTAVDAVATAPAARTWWVPGPGTAAGPPVVPGAAPESLAVQDVASGRVTVSVGVLGASGLRPLRGAQDLGVVPGAAVVLGSSVLAAAGNQALVVRASGPVAVSEDLIPTGRPGVVTLSGVPEGS
jgi:hypothetical protein